MTTTATVPVPGTDPDILVAAFPGFEDVTVLKLPQAFAVFVGETQVFCTLGEEDGDFAAACAYGATEAARIYRENA